MNLFGKLVLSATLCVSTAFFGLGAVAKPVSAHAVSANSTTLTANISSFVTQPGKIVTVTLEYNGQSLVASNATWATTDSSVVTVRDGIVNAVGAGKAAIVARYNGELVQIDAVVSNITALEANVSKVTLNKGNTKTVSLTYENKAISASKATWSSNNTSIATVNNGVITAKGKGTATITARYNGEKVEIQVVVNESPVLEANVSKVTLNKGKTKTVNLTYDNNSISSSKATWSSSKTSVATVSNGVITAKGKGTATITAKYNGQEVKITVTVNGSSGLEANYSKVTLSKGNSKTIKLTYDDDSLSASRATWTTSKSSVATVSSKGVIKAKAKGKATITAKYDGEKVEIEVTVK